MSSYGQPAAARRGGPLALVALGGFAFLLTIPLGAQAALGGAVVLLVACLLALRDSTAPVFTWTNAAVMLLLLIWFVPIKTYSFPVDLPFQLEPYRVFLLVLIFTWLLGLIAGHSRLSAGGHAYPLILFTAGLFATQILNFNELNAGSTDPEALLALSYLLSFVIVFLLVTSTIHSISALEQLVRVLVVGAAIVAATALYDSRFSYNVFEHLHEWIPILEFTPREVDAVRGGRLRVFGSAQHPIALSVALLMIVPFALLLSRRASTALRSRLWIGAALLCAVGAIATVSRTTVLMVIAMLVVALLLRARAILPYWPLIFVLPVVVHFAAPGALGGIYNSIFPDEGFVSSLGTGRAGQPGSGRLADLGPGYDLWSKSPFVGRGVGQQDIAPELPPGAVEREGIPLIFDNQYLSTLVTTGLLGLIALAWFTWGGVVKLARAAKDRLGPPSDLIAACSVSAAGFGASMIVFDALYFVQCTLIFFLVLAIGFRARELCAAAGDRRAV